MAKKYTVIQTREVEVEANSPETAKRLATQAFYSKKTSKTETGGKVLSLVQVKSTDVKEAA